jgi:hypothetical protein
MNTLTFRVGELARLHMASTLFQDDKMVQYKRDDTPDRDWISQVQKVFHDEHTHQYELIRTLLVVALLSGNREVGLPKN